MRYGTPTKGSTRRSIQIPLLPRAYHWRAGHRQRMLVFGKIGHRLARYPVVLVNG